MGNRVKVRVTSPNKPNAPGQTTVRIVECDASSFENILKGEPTPGSPFLFPVIMKTHYDAKQIKQQASIITLLAAIGHQPVRYIGKEAYYLSPLHAENHASFTVDDEKGGWYDHSDGRGGTIIDLGLCLWPQLSFPEVLEEIARRTNIDAAIKADYIPTPPKPRPVKVPNYHILEIRDLGANHAISNYLAQRGIDSTPGSLLKEVYYYIEDEQKRRKNFFAVGWQNETGAWEISSTDRRKFCLGHKAISFIPGDKKQLAVFEGMFDYLSWLAEHPFAKNSALVLNSVALLPSGISKAKEFAKIELYFDHDPAGRKATLAFQLALPQSIDRSDVYQGYNDYNEKRETEHRDQAMQQEY